MKYRLDLIKSVYVEAKSVDDAIEQMKKWEVDGTFKSEDWDEIYIDEVEQDVTLGDVEMSISVDIIPQKNDLN